MEVKLSGSQQHGKRMCNSAPEKPSRIPPWRNSNNNGAHDQSSEPAFLPLALSLLPRTTQRCGAGYPPAVMGEPGLAQPRRRSEEEEWGRVGRWRRKKKEGARAAVRNEQPKICSGCTVNSGSDCSGLTAPAEVGSIWASSVFCSPCALQH